MREFMKKIARGTYRVAVQTFSRLFPTHVFKSPRNELIRVGLLPRHTEFDVCLDGTRIRVFDRLAYISHYNELFGRQIYRFRARSENPYILDCGANVGLSVIYFKKLYPDSTVVAFEPDPSMFGLLQNNIRALSLSDVTAIPRGVWSSDGDLSFVPDTELGLGGRVVEEAGVDNSIRVPVTRLRRYLDRHIDFLKLDVEGAECEVIADCADLLGSVDNIFVEYHSFADRRQCLGQIMRVLADAGFRLYVESGGASSRNPFVRLASYENRMDMQLNIFGMRQQQ